MAGKIGCMRWAARQDGNHSEIVQALLMTGVSVEEIKRRGGGCPDLLTGFHGVNRLLEIKELGKKLSKKQKKWHDSWAGLTPYTVCSIEEALAVHGIYLQNE